MVTCFNKSACIFLNRKLLIGYFLVALLIFSQYAVMPFSFFFQQIYAWGASVIERFLASASNFISAEFTLPLHLHMTFIRTFFGLQA